MLAEIGIIPDVFDRSSYSSPEFGDECLWQLLCLCREEAVVRDFCDGLWSQYLRSHPHRWHAATKEVLESLCKDHRLCRTKQVLPNKPENDTEWYYEALASSKKMLLNVLVAGSPSTLGCADDPAVTDITKLSRSTWWRERSPSVRVKRQTEAYLRLLAPVLRRAGSFMFIDPYIDETRENYDEFCEVIRKLGGPDNKPRIEIHIWEGTQPLPIKDLELRLEKTKRELLKSRLNAEVYVWPVKFHDRYLITDLIGISLPYGFDVAMKDSNGNQETTWGRLGGRDRSAIELQFHPNARRFGIPKQFQLGPGD